MMSKEILISDNTEIKNHKFHSSKHPMDINNADIDKALICNKI